MAVVLMACGGSVILRVTLTPLLPAGERPSTRLQATGVALSIRQAELLQCTHGAITTTQNLLARLQIKTLGVTMKVDYFASNEDLITKLATAAVASSGFDIVVPTGPYIVQMVEKGLIQKFDKTLASKHGQR